MLLHILLALGHLFVGCLLVGQIYAAGSWLREPRTCCMGCRACCMLHNSFFFLLRAGGCGIIAIRLCFYIFCLRLGMILLGVWLLGLKIFFLARAQGSFFFIKELFSSGRARKKGTGGCSCLQLNAYRCLCVANV